MKKRLLNSGWLLSLMAFMALGFTSCDEDRDSNPTLDLSHVSEGFVLNTPANAANNTYDLINASSVELTCTQPNYGNVPYVVRYYVQVSNESSFENFKELSTSYTTAKMDVDALELNDAIVALYTEANPDTDYPNTAAPVYIKLRAVIDGTANDTLGQTYSNQIELPSVLATYQAPKATYPDQLYVVGSSIQVAWTSWKVVPPVYGMEGNYYTLIYVPDGGTFKWGTYNGDWRGYSRIRNFNDVAGAGLSEDSDGNIKVDVGGWYVLLFAAEIVGNSVQYDLNVYPGAAYIMGAAANGGAWTDADPACAMTAPSDQTGTWVSPAFTGSGEMRAYIKVPGFDWWRTEFTLYEGNVYFRDVDIANSWSENVGSEYSVTVTAGQKLYVNFDYNTGEVK